MLDDRRWHRPHEGLWTYRVPLRILGVEAGRRGVVARYGADRWAFIGPVPLDPAARRELDQAGSVDALIVPTAFHNTFVAEACDAFPQATVYAAEGARTKNLPRPRVRSLVSDLPDSLREELEPFPLAGLRAGHEVVFVHRSSGSLIVGDLCMHFPDPADRAWARWFMRLFGWTPGLRVPSLIKRLMRDRGAVRASLESIRQRPLKRIVMAHGEPVEHDVDAALGGLIRQLR